MSRDTADTNSTLGLLGPYNYMFANYFYTEQNATEMAYYSK